MSLLYPFRALRPAPSAAAEVASVPYDVVNTDEARALATGHPLSFLHVTRAEIDLPRETSPYDATVYDQAVRNFEELKRAAPLVIEDAPSLYFYRLRMGTHEQIGLAGCFSVDEYDRGLIKKHEKTRKEKEDDRTRHLIELRAQTGVVFLTYRASPTINALAAKAVAATPLYDIKAPDGIAHTIWRVTGTDADALVSAFGKLPALYIADGHHRAASAARAWESLGRSGESGRFIAVAFPDDHVQILPYNRTVKDLGGKSPQDFMAALAAKLPVTAGTGTPARPGDVSMFLGGQWHTITLAPAPADASRADSLDVEQLQQQVLGPLLGVGDPRTDKRIDFCGGIRGTAELERLVTSGQAAVAFSMRAVAIEDLMAIADAGGIMPPKSTWFEPKLRDGLLVHLI
jgi:uncharacterized protein (DUF1015 family)